METVDSDVEVVQALDFEPDIACAYRSPVPQDPCVLRAEWYSRCRTCGSCVPMCGPHKVHVESVTGLVACPFRPRAWMHVADLLEFIPIGLMS